MSQSPETSPFQPNIVIELSDGSQLAEFEQLVADHISPATSPAAALQWAGRARLVDELRPRRFSGRLVQIQLAVMENATDAMCSARDRGLVFMPGTGNAKQIKRFRKNENIGRALGFTLLGMAESTGRSNIGQVQAEIWYQKGIPAYGGVTAVQRIMTRPKMNANNFVELDTTSRLIALALLRSGLSRTRPNAFHN